MLVSRRNRWNYGRTRPRPKGLGYLSLLARSRGGEAIVTTLLIPNPSLGTILSCGASYASCLLASALRLIPPTTSNPFISIPAKRSPPYHSNPDSQSRGTCVWTWFSPRFSAQASRCLWYTGRLDAALHVLLVFSVLLALGTVALAIAVPPEGEQFKECYILTEDDNGELVAANYPTDMDLGETADIVVGVSNQEHEDTSYTVVVQLQEVAFEEDAAGNVTNTSDIHYDEIDCFTMTLAHNETWHYTHAFEPTFAGAELRLQYLLYEGDVPDEPTRENAYRDLHLWVDVQA